MMIFKGLTLKPFISIQVRIVKPTRHEPSRAQVFDVIQSLCAGLMIALPFAPLIRRKYTIVVIESPAYIAPQRFVVREIRKLNIIRAKYWTTEPTMNEINTERNIPPIILSAL